MQSTFSTTFSSSGGVSKKVVSPCSTISSKISIFA